MTTRAATRRRREGGHVMVEMALGFLPYFAIVFGIMDFSMAMFMMGLFQDAVREGCRYAITYSTTFNGVTYASQTAAIQAVIEANSLGFITAGNVATYTKVNYYLPNNLSTPATQSSLPQTVNGVVINWVNQTGNVVEVRIQGFPWNWMVPLPKYMPGTGLTLGSSSLDVLQGLPVGMLVPPAP